MRTNCTTQPILYTMYCCITMRLAVGVTAADTLLNIIPLLLMVSTDLQVRGVLIRGSLVQNGTVSEYKYHRPKLITAAYEYQLFSCCFSQFSVFSKNSRSCCCELPLCNLVTIFTKYLFVSPHCLLVPYPSWKNVAPFSVFPFTQKRDRRFPRISGIVSVSFAVYWTLALTTTETRLCGLLVCTRVLILPSVRGLACALPCPICDEAVSMPRNRFSSCKFRSV